MFSRLRDPRRSGFCAPPDRLTGTRRFPAFVPTTRFAERERARGENRARRADDPVETAIRDRVEIRADLLVDVLDSRRSSRFDSGSGGRTARSGGYAELEAARVCEMRRRAERDQMLPPPMSMTTAGLPPSDAVDRAIWISGFFGAEMTQS